MGMGRAGWMAWASTNTVWCDDRCSVFSLGQYKPRRDSGSGRICGRGIVLDSSGTGVDHGRMALQATRHHGAGRLDGVGAGVAGACTLAAVPGIVTGVDG